MSDNTVSQALTTMIEGEPPAVLAITDLSTDNEIEYVQQNLADIISQGRGALTELIEIAKQSGHPRAFEVVTLLIDSLVNANEKIMETKKLNQDINRANQAPGETHNHNNNLFLTPAAFSKWLENKSETE